MQFEIAEKTLIGNRSENQDRVAVSRRDGALLIVVVDGMGGHSDGARAAELAVSTLLERFEAIEVPLLDPQGFMHLSIGAAHKRLVELGRDQTLESRPRATCAVCLVQDGACWWGHVGDSRIYHVRAGEIADRTRDHSHVELMIQEGLITEGEAAIHPMRNYVECCLGGDEVLPGMTVSSRRPLSGGDVLLACTDGFWSGADEEAITGLGTWSTLDQGLQELADGAVRASAPNSDNTSVVALRCAD